MLEKIFAFLKDDSARWCQGSLARDWQGKPVSSEDKLARSWGIGPLIKKCYPEHEEQIRVRNTILASVPEKTIWDLNERSGMTVDTVIQIMETLDV